MDLTEIDKIIDQVILKAATPDKFSKLREKQKIVGATEMLIGTTTRNGIEAFFAAEFKYLWKDALIGLKLFSDNDAAKQYQNIVANIKRGIKQEDAFVKFQHVITIEKFDTLYSEIRKYVLKNIEEIK